VTHAVGIGLQGKPDLRWLVRHKAGRENASDCVRLAAQQNGVSDQASVAAEAALPEIVTEDRDAAGRTAVGVVFLVRKGSAVERGGSEQAEVGGRHMQCLHLLR
jgi:hypothetical protein